MEAKPTVGPFHIKKIINQKIFHTDLPTGQPDRSNLSNEFSLSHRPPPCVKLTKELTSREAHRGSVKLKSKLNALNYNLCLFFLLFEARATMLEMVWI